MGDTMGKVVNQDAIESLQSESELADEIMDQASKLEALCAAQMLIASEGLSVPARHRHSFARVLEAHARELRRLLALLLD